MTTLYDLGLEVQQIREAINSIEVKGAENAAYIAYAFNKCNKIIRAINEIRENQNGDGKEG